MEREFLDLNFFGTTFVPQNQSISERNQSIQASKIKTIKTNNTQTSIWEATVLDKIKLLIKQSGLALDEIFRSIDTN